MSIEEVAAELYALVPEEFTAARNARAKAAKADGDTGLARAVQSLRKPTAGAWLVNQWVRGHADAVQQLLELGARLRAAQGTLSADELRALDRQRRQLTQAMAEQARDLGLDAGRRVTDATTAEVEETLRSAMVEEVAGAALATGLLTDTFSSTGLDPVDLSRVVALAPAHPAGAGAGAPAAAPPDDDAAAATRERELADAEAAVSQADSALSAALKAARRAGDEAAEAQRRREELEATLEEARRRVADLEDEVATAAEAADAATAVQQEAQREESAAVEAADRLREALEALRG